MSEETTTSEKVAEIIETIGGLTVLESVPIWLRR